MSILKTWGAWAVRNIPPSHGFVVEKRNLSARRVSSMHCRASWSHREYLCVLRLVCRLPLFNVLKKQRWEELGLSPRMEMWWIGCLETPYTIKRLDDDNEEKDKLNYNAYRDMAVWWWERGVGSIVKSGWELRKRERWEFEHAYGENDLGNYRCLRVSHHFVWPKGM